MSVESNSSKPEAMEQSLNRAVGLGLIAVEEVLTVVSYFRRDPKGSILATARYLRHLVNTARDAVVDEVNLSDLDLLSDLDRKPTNGQ